LAAIRRATLRSFFKAHPAENDLLITSLTAILDLARQIRTRLQFKGVGAPTMKRRGFFRTAAVLLPALLAACGTYTPDKDPFTSNAPQGVGGPTRQGQYENDIVIHVTCEIGEGLRLVQLLGLKRLTGSDWGTMITQSITVEDQTGLAPGVTGITPMSNQVFTFPTGGNVTSPQLFSWSVGGTASANSLRTEMIQYTFKNSDILANTNPGCLTDNKKGVMIDGDLKIKEFIYDKAQIWAANNATLVGTGPKAYQLNPFNTFTEEITFVASYGGSFTPTWKLARMSANASSNLIVGQRTNTNDLVITMGPVKKLDAKGKPIDSANSNTPVQLEDNAVNQHQARVQAAAIAVSITGQSH
jgi:hypothetical protein